MNHPYDMSYLINSMKLCGAIFDFATNFEGRNLDYFIENYFIKKAALDIQTGNPFVLAGLSFNEAYSRIVGYETQYRLPMDKSPEYWAGWVLAFTQWYHNRTFSELLSVISASSLVDMYYPLHEANETNTADIFEEKILNRDLIISDEIELDSIKAFKLYREKGSNYYAVLFLLTKIENSVRKLSKGYLEDSKEFPWREISSLVKSALDGAFIKKNIDALVHNIVSKLNYLEEIRKNYILRIIEARFGTFHMPLLKEYDEKENKREVPKLLKELNKAQSLPSL